ncbi:MAG: SUMF1/EgtB/PvdO family nonheme iron enzyme [Bryobacteraceae bacterium]
MRLPSVLLLLTSLSAAEFIQIPAGEQTVKDAATGFQVKVQTGAFLLGRTEVTQRQYAQVMGVSPSHYKGASRPVENITWREAIDYANRRSELERLTPCYDLTTGQRRFQCTGYRLPTSVEWAYAFEKPAGAEFRNSGYEDTAALITTEKQGTKDVAQGSPNKHGIHDMTGNVWEWCEDWYSPDPALDAIRDPQGPPTGVAKVIRGGSFLTGGSQWNKGLLSSLDPRFRSQFTGFRLARTISAANGLAPPDGQWLAQFQHATPNRLTLPRQPNEIRRIWTTVLGTPKLPATTPTAHAIRSFGDATWNADLFDLAIEPNYATRILIAAPVRKPAGRLPVILVPYYDVDTPAGADLGGRRYTAGGTRAFARLAAQRGFLAVAIKWYGEADAEGYDEAVYQLAKRHPGVTPMGKWIWDLQRVMDYLLTRPDVDPARIGIIGHSLGGKMALYGAAFEPRIKAIVSSEPGISLKFSNYQDFWYLGKAIEQLLKDADHHELLALISPRPFLLIAGESADGDKSWPFIAAAQQVYERKDRIGMINHRTGHSPTEESVQLAMEWLERFLR